MAVTTSGKDVIYSEWPSSSHIKHSASTGTVTLAASGTTTLTITQPTPVFAIGEQVQLRNTTSSLIAKAVVTASTGTAGGSGSVTIQPWFSSADTGSVAGASFTSATVESVNTTPTRAATLTIDLRDAPVGATFKYLILGTVSIGNSSTSSFTHAWVRAQATTADPYAGTSDIGRIRTKHTGGSTHSLMTARRETLSAGSIYRYQLEFASDDANTAGTTSTADYAALTAIRYTTEYVATTAANGLSDGSSPEATSTSNALTPAYTTARTLGSNAVPAGSYIIFASAAVGTSNVTDDSVLRLVTDAAGLTEIAQSRYVFDDVSDYYPFSYVGLKTLTGSNEIRLQLARAGTTSTAKAKNIQLCAIAIPPWIAATASSDFTGETASITTSTGTFNLLKASASVSLSEAFHLEFISAAVSATTGGTLIAPQWNDPATTFGARNQGSNRSLKTYQVAWLKGRSRITGSTTNWILATPTTTNTTVAVHPQFYWMRTAYFPDPGLESRPASAALGSTNFLRSASIASRSSEAANYPARYLLSDHRTRRWRSASSSVTQQVVFDLGSARLPTMLGLIDYNGTTGQIILESSSNSSFSANLQSYTFWTGSVSQQSRTFVFYPGSDNWGATPTARQFWRLTLPAGATTDAFHELGTVWLGTYEPFDYVSGLSIAAKDESPVAEARAGARYVDQYRPFASVSLSVEYLALAAAQSLRDRLLGLRQDPVLLDVHGVSSAAGLYPYGRFYGYLEAGGISADLQGGNNNSLSISFVEARG